MTITHILKPCYSKLDSLYFITESEDDGGEDNKGVALLASVFESSAFLTTKKEVFDFITIVIKATEDPVNKGGLLGGGERNDCLWLWK